MIQKLDKKTEECLRVGVQIDSLSTCISQVLQRILSTPKIHDVHVYLEASKGNCVVEGYGNGLSRDEIQYLCSNHRSTMKSST